MESPVMELDSITGELNCQMPTSLDCPQTSGQMEKQKIETCYKVIQKGLCCRNKAAKIVTAEGYVSWIPKHQELRSDTLIHSLTHLYRTCLADDVLADSYSYETAEKCFYL